jgi:hypothetical protein
MTYNLVWECTSESGEVQSHQRYMQPGGAV